MAFVFIPCERCHGHRRESTDKDEPIIETHEAWCIAVKLVDECYEEKIEGLQARVIELERLNNAK